VAGGSADLLDLQENRVPVAIDIDGMDTLDVAALFALPPEFFSAAAVVNRPTGLQRLAITLPIHVGHHQHQARLGVLGDSRKQPAALFKIGFSLRVFAALRHGDATPKVVVLFWVTQ